MAEVKKIDYNEKVKFTAPVREDTDETHLFVCVNGKTFLIERGLEVEIPRYVKCAIEDSAKQRMEARKAVLNAGKEG